MGYRPRYQTRTPLTPPAELVGKLVTWKPKGTGGRRGPATHGRVVEYDGESRTLQVEVRQEVSPWQPNPTRTVTIPLSHGPFTLA